MCLNTACRVVLKFSAIAFGVMACTAINIKNALRVGSANAWKTYLPGFFFLLIYNFRKLENYGRWSNWVYGSPIAGLKQKIQIVVFNHYNGAITPHQN